MSAQHNSAFEALGLKPGARRAEVDEAYRRLIKLHHPDRTGGDASRAAEINRAYSLLRRDGLAVAVHSYSVPVAVKPPPRPRSGRGAFLLACAVIAAAIGALVTMDSGGPGRRGYSVPLKWPVAESARVASVVSPLTSFDEPLHAPVIDNAIADAVRFHAAGDSQGASEFSRDCQIRLRQEPNLAWFDSCSAFDEATVTLNWDQPLTDSGPFNGSSVMAREMAAARMLSDDMLGADSRLREIRSRVEVQLIPRIDPGAAQQL